MAVLRKRWMEEAENSILKDGSRKGRHVFVRPPS